MANSTVAQSISRQTVAAALREARIQAAEHKAWINAINRAALNLEACPWVFDGEILRIASASSGTRYTVTPKAASARPSRPAAPAGIGLPGACCARRLKWSSRPAPRSPRPSSRPSSTNCTPSAGVFPGGWHDRPPLAI
jgi:hypothetical protein